MYGPLERIRLVRNKDGKSRGYAFLVYERERDMKGTELITRIMNDPVLTLLLLTAAYKDAEGLKLMNKRLLIDVERGRTVKGWKPRRLAGGLGGRPKKAVFGEQRRPRRFLPNRELTRSLSQCPSQLSPAHRCAVDLAAVVEDAVDSYNVVDLADAVDSVRSIGFSVSALSLSSLSLTYGSLLTLSLSSLFSCTRLCSCCLLPFLLFSPLPINDRWRPRRLPGRLPRRIFARWKLPAKGWIWRTTGRRCIRRRQGWVRRWR